MLLRHALTYTMVTALCVAIVAWPVSIVFRKNVELIHSPDPLKVRARQVHYRGRCVVALSWHPQAGMGARGAFMNSGSRDMGPDVAQPARRPLKD